MKDIYHINYEDLFELDKFFDITNPDQLDEEIECIVNELWIGIGPSEELLKPFFTTFLQSNLLRPLYINYFSLKRIKQNSEKIVINASHIILDIVAQSLDVELSPTRSFHDKNFWLVNDYMFTFLNRKKSFKRELKRHLIWNYLKIKGALFGFKILYMNAGKLDKDIAKLDKKLLADWIPLKNSRRIGWDLSQICEQVNRNIESMSLHIPKKCLKSLIESRVLVYLPDLVNRIGILVEVIEKYKIKLILLSAITHEDHLCLLAAAQIAGVESLVVSHGFTFLKNKFAEDLITYQATLNEIEPRYENSILFKIKSDWFERKI